MRTLNLLLALMFLGFAYLQFNDPDPVLWLLIYLGMAAMSVLAMFGIYYRKVLWVLAAGFIIYCIILWPGVAEWLRQENKSVLFDDVMKMEYPYIEESREFLGLLISLAVIAFYLLRAPKQTTHRN